MSDDEELRLQQAVARGSFAEDFLKNSEFKRIADEIKETLFGEFKNTHYNDSEDRDEIWRKLQSLDWVIQALERSARDGSIAKKSLLERAKEKLNL